MQCLCRIACVLRAPPIEVVQQVKPTSYERTLGDRLLFPVEDARSTDFVGLEVVVDGVVVTLKRHNKTTASVPWNWVMGFVDGTVVWVVEIDVVLAVVGEAAINELLSSLHRAVDEPPLLCVSRLKGEAVARRTNSGPCWRSSQRSTR